LEWDGTEDITASMEVMSGTPTRRNGCGRSCTPGWGCTEAQALRGEGGIWMEMVVVCLAVMSATGTIGNSGRHCARRRCAVPERGVAREEQVLGEEESGAVPEMVVTGRWRGKQCMRWGMDAADPTLGSGVAYPAAVRRGLSAAQRICGVQRSGVCGCDTALG
jgi:hypothetical protein